jgi:hypothetical protein
MTCPVLDEPLPAGLITLEDYAPKIGRSARYIMYYWRPMPGFPKHVGQLRTRARNGGGKGRKVYREAALDAFRDANPGTRPESTRRLVTADGLNLDQRVTWSKFAKIAGVDKQNVYRYRGKPGTPRVGADGTSRLGDMVDWWNNRPGRRVAQPPRRRRRGRSTQAA